MPGKRPAGNGRARCWRAPCGLLWLLLAAPALASSPAAWEMNTFDDFRKGKLTGVSLNRDGRLRLAPRLDAMFNTDQPVIWSIAQAPGGVIYLGTGHRGRLFRFTREGKGEVIFTASEPEIFAVAADSAGNVYAGSSPDGKVYRIAGGKAEVYFEPGAKYIWSLAVGPDGVLYVGTGDQGKVFRVTAAGQGELYYETGQSHVMCLSPEGRNLLAGTEPNGILYRITAKDRAFVLHDADLPEIRAVLTASDGSIYMAALGASAARQAAAAARSAAVAAPATSITVSATALQSGAAITPKETPVAPAAAATPPSSVPVAPPLEVAGADKAAIYRIGADNSVRKLWSSTEESVYDLAWNGSGVLLSTDKRGRVYELDGQRKLTLLYETRESEALRLLQSGADLMVATSGLGRLYKLTATSADAGMYEAPVHDAGGIARWGRLSWLAELCPDCTVRLYTRSGNSAVPDRTWSDWSAPLSDPRGSLISSPNARYIQWKAELRAAHGQSPMLDSVRLAYLGQNTTPAVKSITVSAQTMPAIPVVKPAAQSSSTGPAFSITVTDTGESGASSLTGTPSQPITRASSEYLLISWQAEDADGDKLCYKLDFRGEGQRDWKLLKDYIEELNHRIDAEALADGRYYFRVTASDRLVNAPDQAQESELVSAPVLVDRTPPVVSASRPSQTGPNLRIEVEAADAASPLTRCEYSIDAGPWIPMAPRDGVADSTREQFTLQLNPAPPGEHLLVIRAYDSANNAGLAKLVLR